MNFLNKIWAKYSNDSESDKQLSLLEVYNNSVKFRKLFLDFSEILEDDNDRMTSSMGMGEQNFNFLQKNETQLAKYGEINAIKINQFVNFLKDTIMTKLIKQREDHQLKALLKNLSKHEK
jgi:hypothetical protein